MQSTNNTNSTNKKQYKLRATTTFKSTNANSANSSEKLDACDELALKARPYNQSYAKNEDISIKNTCTDSDSTKTGFPVDEKPSKKAGKAFKNVLLQNGGLDTEKTVQSNGSSSIVEELANLKMAVDTSKVIVNELVKHRNINWSDLNISNKTISVVKSNGYEFPSPVQYQSIPAVLDGSDVLVRAKNGTGKSLSIIIPILEKIDPDRNTLQAIILVPIRELALQIAKIIKTMCNDRPIKSTPIVGGSDLTDDIIRVSSGVHILIGTPGRVLDVMGVCTCKIESNPLIIFDEADKLLDSVFYESVHNLLELVPKKRQICLYSATFPTSIKSFVDMRMNNPKLIKISNEYTLENISQFYIKINKNTKLPCLKSILMSLDIRQCIIYCNYIHSVQMLAQKITEMGLSSYFIHSKMSQDERNTVYHNFSRNKCQILVSTDITTRGIDVSGINVVINFDLPITSESYLHRLGRAGRFGTKGCCISLIQEDDMQVIDSFANFVGSSVLPACDESFRSHCKN